MKIECLEIIGAGFYWLDALSITMPVVLQAI